MRFSMSARICSIRPNSAPRLGPGHEVAQEADQTALRDLSARKQMMRAEKLFARFLRRSSQGRTYWKATLRSAPPLAFILLGQWHQRTRIFRWKWLAVAVAHHHKLRSGNKLMTETVIEQYLPGANIVRLQDATRPGS